MLITIIVRIVWRLFGIISRTTTTATIGIASRRSLFTPILASKRDRNIEEQTLLAMRITLEDCIQYHSEIRFDWNDLFLYYYCHHRDYEIQGDVWRLMKHIPRNLAVKISFICLYLHHLHRHLLNNLLVRFLELSFQYRLIPLQIIAEPEHC